MKVEGREEIKTTLGTFKTLRVQPTADAGVVKNRGNIWIWYTDDDRHLPVQMRARLFWGTITFRLTGNENKYGRGQPGDSGPQFRRTGKRILFLSGREGGQQVWLADFDPATGATSNAKKLTAFDRGRQRESGRRTGNSIVFTSSVYPDCPAITPADFATGTTAMRIATRRSRRAR
jgi:hypothetical protein